MVSKDRGVLGAYQEQVKVSHLQIYSQTCSHAHVYMHMGVCVCAHAGVCVLWGSPCLHTESRSGGSEITYQGVIWDEGKYVCTTALRKVCCRFKKLTRLERNLLIAKIRLGPFWKDHTKKVETFCNLERATQAQAINWNGISLRRCLEILTL